MDTLVRGTLVSLSTHFVDANGSPVVPASATLRMTFQRAGDGQLVSAELPMSVSGGVFSADWDSSVAGGGTVFWSVRSQDPAIVQDGSIALTANAANLPPTAGPSDTEVKRAQLVEARSIRHLLITQGGTRSLREGDREMTFTPASVSLLEGYINELERELGITTTVFGPKRAASRRVIF